MGLRCTGAEETCQSLKALEAEMKLATGAFPSSGQAAGRLRGPQTLCAGAAGCSLVLKVQPALVHSNFCLAGRRHLQVRQAVLQVQWLDEDRM